MITLGGWIDITFTWTSLINFFILSVFSKFTYFNNNFFMQKTELKEYVPKYVALGGGQGFFHLKTNFQTACASINMRLKI